MPASPDADAWTSSNATEHEPDAFPQSPLTCPSPDQEAAAARPDALPRAILLMPSLLASWLAPRASFCSGEYPLALLLGEPLVMVPPIFCQFPALLLWEKVCFVGKPVCFCCLEESGLFGALLPGWGVWVGCVLFGEIVVFIVFLLLCLGRICLHMSGVWQFLDLFGAVSYVFVFSS
jgi:hypothetical protein